MYFYLCTMHSLTFVVFFKVNGQKRYFYNSSSEFPLNKRTWRINGVFDLEVWRLVLFALKPALRQQYFYYCLLSFILVVIFQAQMLKCHIFTEILPNKRTYRSDGASDRKVWILFFCINGNWLTIISLCLYQLSLIVIFRVKGYNS